MTAGTGQRYLESCLDQGWVEAEGLVAGALHRTPGGVYRDRPAPGSALVAKRRRFLRLELGKEQLSALTVPDRDAPPVFEAGKAVVDPMPLSARLGAMVCRVLSSSSRRDACFGVAFGQRLSESVGITPLVGRHAAWLGAVAPMLEHARSLEKADREQCDVASR